jgi:hypothetical protein
MKIIRICKKNPKTKKIQTSNVVLRDQMTFLVLKITITSLDIYEPYRSHRELYVIT